MRGDVFPQQELTSGGGDAYFPERDENIGNAHVKHLFCSISDSYLAILRLRKHSNSP